MPPVVAIVGRSDSGKTTLVVKLVRELKSRGYRVATVKHTPREVSLGEPHKDSWRHLEAGSDAAATSSPDRVVMVRPVARELALDEVLPLLGEDFDLVLAEGFKSAAAPKIEVHRREVGPPLTDLTRLIAIVTDEPLDTRARQFSPDDVSGLANLLEDGFIKPNRERIVLYVNGAPVHLGSFPAGFMTNVLLGMAASLKGVGEVTSLQVFLRRESAEDKKRR